MIMINSNGIVNEYPLGLNVGVTSKARFPTSPFLLAPLLLSVLLAMVCLIVFPPLLRRVPCYFSLRVLCSP